MKTLYKNKILFIILGVLFIIFLSRFIYQIKEVIDKRYEKIDYNFFKKDACYSTDKENPFENNIIKIIDIKSGYAQYIIYFDIPVRSNASHFGSYTYSDKIDKLIKEYSVEINCPPHYGKKL